MRVLIVGGGVAGLTLAAKLRQQGREPTVIESATEYAPVGFGLGLYPLGSSVLHGLGVYEDYLAESQELRTYRVADARGRVLQELDMAVFSADMGPMLMSTRATLVETLRRACWDLPVRMGTTVASLRADDEGVEVALSDGTESRYDLVAACDGIASPTRAAVFGEQPGYDSGWTAWTFWGREGLFPAETAREYWGPGFLFGVYPVPGRTTFVAVVPNRVADPSAADRGEETLAVLRRVFARLATHEPAVGQALAEVHDLYAWRMRDVRSREWARGRVVLVGDAATAFLPTAGIGASTAMRGASGLADELSRADAAGVPLALSRYERRCRRFVEGNQRDSRNLAKLMFVSSHLAAWGRDRLLSIYPAERLVSSIRKSMLEPF